MFTLSMLRPRARQPATRDAAPHRAQSSLLPVTGALQLAPAVDGVPGELVWSSKHCQTSRLASDTPSFETASATHQSVAPIHAPSPNTTRLPGIQISLNPLIHPLPA